MSMVSPNRYRIAAVLFLLAHYPAAATSPDSGDVFVHVQVLKNGTIAQDVILTIRRGETANACFGKKPDVTGATLAQQRINCEGLQVAFSPRELRPDLIRASFAIEYRVPDNSSPATFNGFSVGGNFPMTPGTPIVTSDGPYILRVSARY